MTTKPVSGYSIILLLISITLFIGIPFALKHFPNPDVSINLWDLSNTARFETYRMTVLVVGCALAFAAFVFLLLSMLKRQRTLRQKALDFSLFTLAFSIGLIDYVYWANGHFVLVMESYHGNPGFLKTATYYANKYWNDLISFHLLLVSLIIPIFIIVQMVSLFRKRTHWVLGILTITFSLLSIAVTYNFYGDFFFWLSD